MTRSERRTPRTGRADDGGFLGYLREKAPVWGAIALVAVAATIIFLVSPTPAAP